MEEKKIDLGAIEDGQKAAIEELLQDVSIENAPSGRSSSKYWYKIKSEYKTHYNNDDNVAIIREIEYKAPKHSNPDGVALEGRIKKCVETGASYDYSPLSFWDSIKFALYGILSFIPEFKVKQFKLLFPLFKEYTKERSFARMYYGEPFVYKGRQFVKVTKDGAVETLVGSSKTFNNDTIVKVR